MTAPPPILHRQQDEVRRQVVMWLFVFNLLGVVAFFVLPGIASYGYLVTQETTYQEFIRVGAIDEEQLAKLTPPGGSVGSG